MAQDTTLTHGEPGIASFASQSYGGPGEPRYGEGVPTTTDEIVTAGGDLDLPIYSVVSVIAGVIALAGIGTAQGAATGTLTIANAVPAADDEFVINGQAYVFVAALTDGGEPYEVLIGGTITATMANLAAAINGAAGEGTTYGEGTEVNPDVSATASVGVVTLVARDPGDEGNAITIAKTFATGANGSVSAATLASGTDDADALPFGILAHPLVLANGESMSVSFYREGHWDMDQLNWGASFVTDAQKKHAFEGSRSPNIFISKKKFPNSAISL